MQTYNAMQEVYADAVELFTATNFLFCYMPDQIFQLLDMVQRSKETSTPQQPRPFVLECHAVMHASGRHLLPVAHTVSVHMQVPVTTLQLPCLAFRSMSRWLDGPTLQPYWLCKVLYSCLWLTGHVKSATWQAATLDVSVDCHWKAGCYLTDNVRLV